MTDTIEHLGENYLPPWLLKWLQVIHIVVVLTYLIVELETFWEIANEDINGGAGITLR